MLHLIWKLSHDGRAPRRIRGAGDVVENAECRDRLGRNDDDTKTVAVTDVAQAKKKHTKQKKKNSTRKQTARPFGIRQRWATDTCNNNNNNDGNVEVDAEEKLAWRWSNGKTDTPSGKFFAADFFLGGGGDKGNNHGRKKRTASIGAWERAHAFTRSTLQGRRLTSFQLVPLFFWWTAVWVGILKGENQDSWLFFCHLDGCARPGPV